MKKFLKATLLMTSVLVCMGQTHANPVVGADAHAPERATGWTDKEQVVAKDFMVATANPLATQAGYDILKKGGSAIDAMVAVQTTLGLVEPQSSGLGGGAFVVYWDNTAKKLTTFDGRETAPLAVTPELFLDNDGKPLKFTQAVVGGRSVGVPAIPLLMEELHKRYGKLAWESLFDEPIKLATEGFAVSPRMAKSIVQYESSLKTYPKTAEYFFPNGQALQAGQMLKNTEYANAVGILAKQGSRPFYQGELAQNIVNAVQNAPSNAGVLSMVDMNVYHIIEREPVCATYRIYEVCGMDAPSSGGVALGQIMGILNEFSPDEVGKHSDGLRKLGDASRLAFADRDRYMADPDFVFVPSQLLLSPSYLKERANLIKNTEQALPTVEAGKVMSNKNQISGNAIELPSTSHISIVDKYGNVLSMTTSIENAFGSTLMANGYLLNNELTDFNFEPIKDGKWSANRVQAGKRPRSSMAPTIVLRDGVPYMSVGSPGGSRIIGYVAKTLLAHVDWGMPIQEAISFPNVINRFGTYEIEMDTGAVYAEPALQKLGFSTQIRELNSGVQGIVIGDDGLIGGADPRREGRVMGD